MSERMRTPPSVIFKHRFLRRSDTAIYSATVPKPPEAILHSVQWESRRETGPRPAVS